MEKIQKFVDHINRYMASRQPLDVRALYARFASRYPGGLRIEDGDREHGEDFQILCGSSPAGRFEIFDNRLDIVFDVVKPDGGYTHWHPADPDEAAEDLEAFMDGHSKY